MNALLNKLKNQVVLNGRKKVGSENFITRRKEMGVLVLIFIALFFIKLYLAECIVTSSINLSLVESTGYEAKDWKNAILLFKGCFWKFQVYQMMQLMYTTLVLLMIQAGAFMYKNHVMSMGSYSYRNLIEANVLIVIAILVVVACNNLVINGYRQETIRIRDLGNRAGVNVWAYMQGRHPNREDVMEIRAFSIENQIQHIGYYIIHFPLWSKLSFANRIQLSEGYIKYIFQSHQRLGKRFVKVRIGFANGLQVISNVVIVIAGVKAIIT